MAPYTLLAPTLGSGGFYFFTSIYEESPQISPCLSRLRDLYRASAMKTSKDEASELAKAIIIKPRSNGVLLLSGGLFQIQAYRSLARSMRVYHKYAEMQICGACLSVYPRVISKVGRETRVTLNPSAISIKTQKNSPRGRVIL